eukprot:scaffold641919_cov19-Prasinocladus_malaysianus.AAC.2
MKQLPVVANNYLYFSPCVFASVFKEGFSLAFWLHNAKRFQWLYTTRLAAEALHPSIFHS